MEGQSFALARIRTARAVVVAACAWAVAGCATGTRSIEILDPVPAPEDAATIVIRRTGQACGSHPLTYVLIDDRPVAALATDQHTTFEVSAGLHTLAILHPVIDQPLLVGSGAGALAVGAAYGMRGTVGTESFAPRATHSYLLRADCAGLDEAKRFRLERVSEWPEGQAPAPSHFVPAGKRPASRPSP
jgi:hypothetical protein